MLVSDDVSRHKGPVAVWAPAASAAPCERPGREEEHEEGARVPSRAGKNASLMAIPCDAAPFSSGLSVKVNSEAEVRQRGTKPSAVVSRSPHFLQINGVFSLGRAEVMGERAQW